MRPDARSLSLLVADDDPDDRLLTRDALADGPLLDSVYFVSDGVELLQFLRREGPYARPAEAPRPGVILLDLNMPRMDGREALQEIKGDPALRDIPVIVLTTSKADEDILSSYELGVSSYIRKPVSYHELVETMKVLGKYWFEVVSLPPARDSLG